MTRSRSGGPLSREERDLWERAMGDVEPLGKRPPPGGAPAGAAPPVQAPRKPRTPPSPGPPPDLQPGSSAGVDRRTASRFRRGQMAVEARLDLHGHGQERAHRALRSFIAASAVARRRCVLVITGKGYRAADGTGVLRAAVPRWLNQAPLRGMVLAIARARPRDGGDGALYVLLRRSRGRDE